MKKFAVLLATIAVFVFAVPAFANGALQINDRESPQGYDFWFWDGNGGWGMYTPSSYHDVITPSGNETEIFKGTIANNTGLEVIYSAYSGAPVESGQTCYSFVTGHMTPDWQLTIDVSGNYVLECHFQKP